jgi:hypothetical protein
MTAKEKLRRVVDDLSEDGAVDVLEMLSGSRALSGEELTQILDGIPGAFESAQRGLQQAREGKTTSLDELRASR